MVAVVVVVVVHAIQRGEWLVSGLDEKCAVMYAMCTT